MIAPLQNQSSPHHILDDIAAFLGRFISYPSEHARVAHTLWIAHTHGMGLWDSTPRIAFLSKEPGSGKSRALEVTELLVPNPVEAVNVSPAYIFRKVGQGGALPTLLYDEIDTVFGPRARENEEIRGLLNAGYRKHSKAGRCAIKGKEIVTEEISAYCAVAFAGLGNLPETILSRSIVIRMRRRKTAEKLERFRRRALLEQGNSLRDQLFMWLEELSNADAQLKWPELPLQISDRDHDIWEALVLLGDHAGKAWGAKAREAALVLTSSRNNFAPTRGAKLLADIKTVFHEDRLPTVELISRLISLEEAPWGSINGQPLDARMLAYELRGYDIHPHTLRFDDLPLKGYRIFDFQDAWDRYLPAFPGGTVTGVTNVITQPKYSQVTDVTVETPSQEKRGIVT
jgi:hypothetical protein